MTGVLAVDGDTRRLEQLIDALGNMSRGEFRSGMLSEMAHAAVQLVQEEFVFSSADPYGNPWRPLKKARAGLGGPLLKTGKLMRSVKRRVTFDGFTLRSTDPKAVFHQNGTRRMPARPFLPQGELPFEWVQRFEEIADAAIERAIGRFR